MHRFVVVLLVATLIAVSGAVPVLHTHAYDGHDHPEHRHAAAAHHHALTPIHTTDNAARLGSCNPATHAVAVAFVSAAPSAIHVVTAVLTVPRVPPPDIRVHGTAPSSDVRVHGPPACTVASPRAPPTIAQA